MKSSKVFTKKMLKKQIIIVHFEQTLLKIYSKGFIVETRKMCTKF